MSHPTKDLRVRVRVSIVPPFELQLEGTKQEKSSKIFPFETVTDELEAAFINEHVSKLLEAGATMVITIQEDRSNG